MRRRLWWIPWMLGVVDGRVIVAHVYRTVSDAPVRGGDGFFADDRTTLWVWDPQTRVEFALFTSRGAARRLVELASAVLTRRG